MSHRPYVFFVLFVTLLVSTLLQSQSASANDQSPLRVGIVGLVHGHVQGFFEHSLHNPQIEIVGIAESDKALSSKYATQYGFSQSLLFPDLEEMLQRTHPQAVLVYTNTYDHRRVVETCARHGVHVMMEKPLAVSFADAQAIEKAAHAGKIKVLVNYETTWYPANQAAYYILHQNQIGELRKVVICDGHSGPKEIGCSEDFLRWLTDPVLNGGGALPDFGCYGADLMTWLMDGARPVSVFAVTRHIKPKIYPNVEDEATIVVTYTNAQAILQASWNWPFNRKDMEVYGQTGYILAPHGDVIRVRKSNAPETELQLPPLQGADADPVSYLAAVVRKDIQPSGLSSLQVNLIVTEILDAAKKSARTGKRVDF